VVNENLKFKKLDARAVIPSIATEGSVGYDLSFIKIAKIIGDVVYLDSGLAVQPPPGYYSVAVPRSSVSKFKLSFGKATVGFQMANSVGIIDSDYTGPILFPFRFTGDWNTADEVTKAGLIKALEDLMAELPLKLGQLVLQKIVILPIEEVTELDETTRGSGGFGSTG